MWMTAEEQEKRKRQDLQGSFIGMWIAIGAGFGVALGVIFDSIPIGIAIGASIGVAIGAALENTTTRNRSGEDPRQERIQMHAIGIGLLLLGLMVLLAIIFAWRLF
jgi:hypothetical protein